MCTKASVTKSDDSPCAQVLLPDAPVHERDWCCSAVGLENAAQALAATHHIQTTTVGYLQVKMV